MIMHNDFKFQKNFKICLIKLTTVLDQCLINRGKGPMTGFFLIPLSWIKFTHIDTGFLDETN